MTSYDPQLEPYVDQLPAVALADVHAARREMERVRASFGPTPALRDVRWEDRSIPGEGSSPDVALRVYEPSRRAAEPTPAIVFLHGGGYAMGSVESEHFAAGVLAVAVGSVVVSVDYRLAPEHPYPAALEDAYAALQWLDRNAQELGIDAHRIAVAGFSAGGGLAAALTILARDRQGPSVCYQVLAMPQLDDRLLTPSSRTFVDTPLWTRAAADHSWRYYLADLHGQDSLPITAAPGRAVPEDLAGLPPAYLSCMQNDPLRDEGIAYALALLHAGVNVELHSFPGTFHGSGQVASRVSRREQRELVAALRQALGVDD